MTLRSLNGAHKAPRSAVEFAGCQKLTRLFHRRLNAAEMADRRMLGETAENLRDTDLRGIAERGGARSAETLDREVARGKSLLELAFDGIDLEDLVEIVDREDIHRTRPLIALLPAIMIDFLDEFIASIIADLLEELTEEMGQESSRGDDTLVRVGIAIIHRHVSFGRQKKTTNHGGSQKSLARIMDLGRRILACELDVRELFGVQQITNLLCLVFHLRGILKTFRQVLNRLLLGEDVEIRGFLEGSCQKLSERLFLLAEDELTNLAILGDAQSTEEDHEREIFMEAGHTDQKGISETVELGGHTNLELLGGRREGFVQTLHLDRVRVACLTLLVLEDHDAVIGDLLLAENCPLRPVNDELPERILRALPHVLERHGEVLEKTETGTEHHRNLAERDSLEHAGLRLKTLFADRKAEIGKHLSGVGVVADTGFHREHRLHAPGGLRNARLHLAHVLERELELILVLLGGLIELVVDGDRRRRLDDERELVANEVLKALRLMRHQTTNAISTEVCTDCLPLHSYD